MQVPTELKFEILRHVGSENRHAKLDFKAIRLVNKEWSACASPFMFERIYWSPQDLDLEAFEGIVNRPNLAACVKELVFDAKLGLAPSDGYHEFAFLSSALSIAHVHPTKLSVGSIDISKDRSRSQDTRFGYGKGMRPLVELGDSKMLRCLHNVYQNLTHLSLHMATIDHEVGLPRLMPDLRGFGQLLYSLTNLEFLDLRLPLARYDPLPFWGNQHSYPQVFERKDGRWPKLHTLRLHNIAIGTRHLVSLFRNGLPVLRTLALSMILLLDGKWEWIIEFIHQKTTLDMMSIEYGTALLYPGPNFFCDDLYENDYSGEEYSWLMDAACAYGARKNNFHPSVDFHDEGYKSDESDEKDETRRGQINARLARLYTKELKEFLQITE
ncbi:MAG: hypothetical protein Q9226_004606 [Calogaya cf. arnoldii]